MNLFILLLPLKSFNVLLLCSATRYHNINGDDIDTTNQLYGPIKNKSYRKYSLICYFVIAKEQLKYTSYYYQNSLLVFKFLHW